jgi:hypothetical protein
MNCQREACFLNHVLAIRMNASAQYEISIDGPWLSAKARRTFALLEDAQSEAHRFAHSMLGVGCSCTTELKWSTLSSS